MLVRRGVGRGTPNILRGKIKYSTLFALPNYLKVESTIVPTEEAEARLLKSEEMEKGAIENKFFLSYRSADRALGEINK